MSVITMHGAYVLSAGTHNKLTISLLYNKLKYSVAHKAVFVNRDPMGALVGF